MTRSNYFGISRKMQSNLSIKKKLNSFFYHSLNKKFAQHNQNLLNKDIINHPLLFLLESYVKNNNPLKKKILNNILKLNSIKKNLLFKYPSIIQNKIFLEIPETRGMILKLDKRFSTKDEKYFYKIYRFLYLKMGFEWRQLIKFVKVITFVKFPGRTDTNYFSGSFSAAIGSMHTCKPLSYYNVLECLTHESSHFWLNMLEEDKELAIKGWTKNIYCSPWRQDKRPISGIIHGVFVFSRVILALDKFLRIKKKIYSPKNIIVKRIAYLIAQVKEGAKEVSECKDVTTIGKTINIMSILSIKKIEKKIPKKLLSKFDQIVTNRRREKIEFWNKEKNCK